MDQPYDLGAARLRGKCIALIGGAGFIGHNLALKLRAAGAEVHVVDGLQVNHIASVTANQHDLATPHLYLAFLNERLDLLRKAGIPLHVQDARDYHALTRLLNTIKPQTVVQLAAVAHANRSNKDPHSTFDHSLRTLENALDSVRKFAEHFVYLSSSMVYGNFKTASVTEDANCEPLGIYGALKFAGEKIVIAYNQVFGLPYTIVRPSALYGERCISRRVGQVFVENALLKEPVTVQGDGGDRLDFTYIEDLTQGLTRVIANPRSHNQVFNLTYGQSRSIEEMAEILRSEFPDIEVRHKERDRLMPERGTLSIDKAQDILGYTPEFPLENGYRSYIAWYKRLAASSPDIFPVPETRKTVDA